MTEMYMLDIILYLYKWDNIYKMYVIISAVLN